MVDPVFPAKGSWPNRSFHHDIPLWAGLWTQTPCVVKPGGKARHHPGRTGM